MWFLSCVGGVLDDTQEVIMDSGDGRHRPRRIVVNGPLVAFADGLRRLNLAFCASTTPSWPVSAPSWAPGSLLMRFSPRPSGLCGGTTNG